jgi:radical SAM enzyme (TIGR01210 family)
MIRPDAPFGHADRLMDPDSASVRQARGAKAAVDPWRPIAVWDEEEVAGPFETVDCRVVLLAGAECPFTCAMCDLWRHTLAGPTPPGALPAQIEAALARAPAIPPMAAGPEPRWIKLYNASNFTDPRAVPVVDRPRIAALVDRFERVIIETHPRLVDGSLHDFARSIGGRLEVALGLETIHPVVLPWLNKQMTPADFAAACARLRAADIDARAFVLVGLPGLDAPASIDAAIDAARFAAVAGCRHVSLIPTRSGNGFFDRLAADGSFVPVTAGAAEAALAGSLAAVAADCLVTLDLWDWDRMAGHCGECRAARRARIERMHRARALLPLSPLDCGCRHGL